jgi:large subunit ribosomal protein L4
VKAGRLLVLDQISLESPKTAVFSAILRKSLKLSKVLIVDEPNQNLELSGRNIPQVRVLRAEGINVYDIVRHENLVLTKRAVEAITKRLAVQE